MRSETVELLVNSLIGMVLLVFDVVRGLFEWGDKALLVGVAVAAGAYFGTRAALAGHDRSGSASRT
jgi:hypothetical protein